MLPPNRYSGRQATVLLDWLIEEARRCRSDRTELERKWVEEQQTYRAEPREKYKTWPWPSCSNIVIPVGATDVETMVARIMGILFAPEGLWATKAIRPEMIDFAPRLDEFLRWAQDAELNAYDSTLSWVTEICIHGTGVLKQRYVRSVRKQYQFRETSFGTSEQQLMAMMDNHPQQDYVPLPNFYIPAYARDIDSTPWCAERIELSWPQLLNRVRAGLYVNFEQVGWWWNQQMSTHNPSMYQRKLDDLDRFVPSYNTNFEVMEFSVPSFDIDGDGEPESLICTIHEPTRTYLRIDLNPFVDQKPQYSVARFVKQANQFYGIGLIEMDKLIQEAISTMTNQRIDNNTILNTPIFVSGAGSKLKQDELMWPGRHVKVNDAQKDFQVAYMGQKGDATMAAEGQLLAYAQRRTGVSDYMQGGGGDNTINYAALGTVVNMLKEGGKRTDQTMREIRKALSQSGRRLTEMYQQFDQGGKSFLVLGEKDGQMVEQVLQFPASTLTHGLMIDVTATNASMNKEVEIRTNQIVYGLVMQHYQTMIQSLMMAMNPQVPPPVQQVALLMLQGGSILARRILDSYGQQDVDRIIPNIGDILNGTATSGPGAVGGGAPMGGGPLGASGMGALPAGPQGANGYAPQGAVGVGGPQGYLPSPGGFR